MKICSRCVLPETFPGINFDEQGVCNLCRRADDVGAGDLEAHRRRFEAWVADVRDRPGTHCVLSFSGGKDSTYTLMMLRRHYGLRVRCVTVDNGFLEPQVLENIRTVARNLGATAVIVTPPEDMFCHLFAAVERDAPFPPKALERASNICTACMAVVKNIVLRAALKERAPLVAYGWSPGQAPASAAFFQMNHAMIRAMASVRAQVLERYGGDAIAPFLVDLTALEKTMELPYSANPLAFHPYNEQRILAAIEALGWRAPQDTDGNSTNCRLNGFAIRTHIARYGYHPYALEVAGLVRAGMMTRDEGLASLRDLGSDKTAQGCAVRLGFPPDYAALPKEEGAALAGPRQP